MTLLNMNSVDEKCVVYWFTYKLYTKCVNKEAEKNVWACVLIKLALLIHKDYGLEYGTQPS